MFFILRISYLNTNIHALGCTLWFIKTVVSILGSPLQCTNLPQTCLSLSLEILQVPAISRMCWNSICWCQNGYGAMHHHVSLPTHYVYVYVWTVPGSDDHWLWPDTNGARYTVTWHLCYPCYHGTRYCHDQGQFLMSYNLLLLIVIDFISILICLTCYKFLYLLP